eukprot:CAMPEP_0118926256 /NCGR_PEP_ID=MMETSP1169-20130426/3990_1 /TAXON_ID=36882 /ORGANISM="Pyramimonas obovata, Strain CCMP722" /LENGTH=119 /DNA_ID=CAMNT_0006867771 /DNA_START=173 /DNA_END=532 /DNA_ORIENTATION=+
MADGCWSTGGVVGEGRDSFMHLERYGVYWKGSRLEFHTAARDAYTKDTSHFKGVESKEQERMRNWTTGNAVYGRPSGTAGDDCSRFEQRELEQWLRGPHYPPYKRLDVPYLTWAPGKRD